MVKAGVAILKNKNCNKFVSKTSSSKSEILTGNISTLTLIIYGQNNVQKIINREYGKGRFNGTVLYVVDFHWIEPLFSKILSYSQDSLLITGTYFLGHLQSATAIALPIFVIRQVQISRKHGFAVLSLTHGITKLKLTKIKLQFHF